MLLLILVANTAGYIDCVTVDDFLKLELAEPFRTFSSCSSASLFSQFVCYDVLTYPRVWSDQ
jgi:hypothetical protein